jgi:methionyl-tRNA formyltransferase
MSSSLLACHIIQSARLGCIGFHPTALPRGRGRAPIAWLVLEESIGAANLFLIEQQADTGPVFEQVNFAITPDDNAASVEQKALCALDEAFDRLLPKLKCREWNPVTQDELQASEYGRRLPEDGWIDWQQDALRIDRLIKASTRPHPGAFTFIADRKLIVWASRIETDMRIKGVNGRVLKSSSDGAVLIQTGNGLLWITEYEAEDDISIRVGMRLGYYVEQEVYKLKQDINMLKSRLGL